MKDGPPIVAASLNGATVDRTLFPAGGFSGPLICHWNVLNGYSVVNGVESCRIDARVELGRPPGVLLCSGKPSSFARLPPSPHNLSGGDRRSIVSSL
jgi:hypothetical protein